MKLPDLLHNDIDIKNSEAIDHSHALDDVRMRLSAPVKLQNERERDNRDQVINEIITNVTLGDLLHVTSWHRLSFFRELSKKFERY